MKLLLALTLGGLLARPTDVKSLIALRELDKKALLSLLALDPARVEENARYQKLGGVAHAHNQAVHPGHFYLRGDRVELLYIGSDELLRALVPAAIRQELGGDGILLRSRAGKSANQHVYPEKGFAYSETGGVLDFVEVFRPMSLKEYRERIYEEVGRFTK